MLRWLKKILRRNQHEDSLIVNRKFNVLVKNGPVLAYEFTENGPIIRVGYLKKLKKGILTAYYPSLDKTLTAHYDHNNWVIDKEELK